MEKLKKILAEKNISQNELARKLHITPANMSRYLNGKRKMSIEMYAKICKILKIKMEKGL